MQAGVMQAGTRCDAGQAERSGQIRLRHQGRLRDQAQCLPGRGPWRLACCLLAAMQLWCTALCCMSNHPGATQQGDAYAAAAGCYMRAAPPHAQRVPDSLPLPHPTSPPSSPAAGSLRPMAAGCPLPPPCSSSGRTATAGRCGALRARLTPATRRRSRRCPRGTCMCRWVGWGGSWLGGPVAQVAQLGS
jgi:hypothetical protein